MDGPVARSYLWRPALVAGTGVWLLLLAAGLAFPEIAESRSAAEDLTRNPVRLALLYYGAAASLMIFLRRGELPNQSPRADLARWFWTLAWAAFLVHVGMAFHHYHHWSHAAAVEHTRRASGLGEGIYFSYLFTLLWSVDVLAWWLRPARRAARPTWVGWALHGFMAFMVFNATVVFETSWIRWAGVLLLGELAALGTVHRITHRGPPVR